MIKNPVEKFPPMEKIYHIYAKDRCLFHSIKEDEFETTWSTLKRMVGLMRTDYSLDDLSFEELTVNRLGSSESSH
jgi:negative regulator of replication initiation